MNNITLTLPVDSVNAILQTLGQLPTSTGAWLLLVEVKKQLDEQLAQSSTGE